MTEPPPAALLLYDGDCGFCAASVRFILRHERTSTLRFAALRSAAGDAVRARHPELAGVDSMVWVDHPGDRRREVVAMRSGAALRVGWYLGGAWRPAASLARLVPRFVRDRVYDLIATHRHRLVSADSCDLMPPEARGRFVEAIAETGDSR